MKISGASWKNRKIFLVSLRDLFFFKGNLKKGGAIPIEKLGDIIFLKFRFDFPFDEPPKKRYYRYNYRGKRRDQR
jgi:hypothetical protein